MRISRGFPVIATMGLLACGGTAPEADSPASSSRDDGGPAASPECKLPEGGWGPVILPDPVYANRNGVGITSFSALTTSQEKPLEECGLRAVCIRLVSFTCNDGSRPFGDNLEAAHQSRSGNTGPGGRCGSIIDRYEVPCPEGAYAVFADMYACSQATAGQFM